MEAFKHESRVFELCSTNKDQSFDKRVEDWGRDDFEHVRRAPSYSFDASPGTGDIRLSPASSPRYFGVERNNTSTYISHDNYREGKRANSVELDTISCKQDDQSCLQDMSLRSLCFDRPSQILAGSRCHAFSRDTRFPEYGLVMRHLGSQRKFYNLGSANGEFRTLWEGHAEAEDAQAHG